MGIWKKNSPFRVQLPWYSKRKLAFLSVLSELNHFELIYLGTVLRRELTFLSWAADSSFLFIVLVFSSCWFLSMVASSKPRERSFNLTSWDCKIVKFMWKWCPNFFKSYHAIHIDQNCSIINNNCLAVDYRCIYKALEKNITCSLEGIEE